MVMIENNHMHLFSKVGSQTVSLQVASLKEA